MREMTGSYSGALHVIAGVMLVSILLPIIVHPPRRETSAETIGLTPHPATPKD
jgi:hypothetical protein